MNRTLFKYGARPINAQAAAGTRKRKKSRKQRLMNRPAPKVDERAVEKARKALERAKWERGQG